MNSKIIRLKMRQLRIRLRAILKKLSDQRAVEREHFFETLKEAKQLIEDLKIRYIEEMKTDRLLRDETEAEYLEALSEYVALMSEFTQMMFEPVDINSSLIHKSLFCLGTFISSLEYSEYHDIFKQVVEDIINRGYLSLETEKALLEISDKSPMAKTILDYCNIQYDKTSREILSEILYIIRRAYELSEGKEFPGVPDTYVISSLYQKGDIEAIDALKSWIIEQFYNEYYPILIVTPEILAGAEYISIIARFTQNFISKNKITRHKTLLTSNQVGISTISEIIFQMKADLEAGMSYTDVVAKYFPDQLEGEVEQIIIHVRRK